MQWEINWRTFFRNFFIGLITGLLIEYFAYGHWLDILLFVPWVIAGLPIPLCVYLIPFIVFGIYVMYPHHSDT